MVTVYAVRAPYTVFASSTNNCHCLMVRDAESMLVDGLKNAVVIAVCDTMYVCYGCATYERGCCNYAVTVLRGHKWTRGG